jgi:hypothetical protein
LTRIKRPDRCAKPTRWRASAPLKEGEVLRKHADAAMYAAKAAGGNGYRFWVKPQARLES